ncbi:unnamed protein product, partial [Symbiodinium necroappetens]
ATSAAPGAGPGLLNQSSGIRKIPTFLLSPSNVMASRSKLKPGSRRGPWEFRKDAMTSSIAVKSTF